MGPSTACPFILEGQRPLLCLAEQEELRKLLPEMVRFEPTWEELELYKDGGVAIIDQWICAHARCLAACCSQGPVSLVLSSQGRWLRPSAFSVPV